MPTTVLVIDADADFRATLRLLFEDEGYAVIEAADGGSALTALHTSPSGLVVLFDYRMRVWAARSCWHWPSVSIGLPTTTHSSA